MATPRLRNRQLQIPNGLTFYLPELKWRSPGGASFQGIVNALAKVIAANPYLAQKNQWPTDSRGIEDWVDTYNATICARMGWVNYIQEDAGGTTIPKTSAPHQQATLQSLRNAAVAAKALVAGAKTLNEYLDSGEPPVPADLAHRRAVVCSACPLNEEGDFTKWFTVPAAELIKRQIEKASSRQLTTPRDDDLHLCTACHCPLRLKIHIPIDWIIKRLSPEQTQKLHQGKSCWILQESGL